MSADSSPLLHVVLHQPDIPQNTGNIGRTCVAVGAKLWLVRPLGFQLDEHTSAVPRWITGTPRMGSGR
jgi:tRNA (cytidine/uridine-2'-O-)-methyltransferase